MAAGLKISLSGLKMAADLEISLSVIYWLRYGIVLWCVSVWKVIMSVVDADHKMSLDSIIS